MKLYAIVEFETDSNCDLDRSVVRNALKHADLPGNAHIYRVGVCEHRECPTSMLDSLGKPLYYTIRVRVSDALIVEVVAINVDDAIAKTRVMLQDDPEFATHSKPEWWDIKIVE